MSPNYRVCLDSIARPTYAAPFCRPAADRAKRARPMVGGVRCTTGVMVLCVGLACGGCGGSDGPGPDRQAPDAVVRAFIEAAAREDAEGVCRALTGVGRAQAAGLPRKIGGPTKPASEQRCVEEGARAAIQSEDLTTAVERDWLELKRLRIRRRRAHIDVCNGAKCVTQSLRKTPGGWKIDIFGLPVE